MGANPSEIIRSMKQGERAVTVDWEDGHRSTFHYLWLRYNCACSICGNPETGVGSLMLTDIAPDITPQSISQDNEGGLEVRWAPDGHRTNYTAHWLRLHCYSKAERERRRFKPKLWDATLVKNLPTVDFVEATTTDAGHLRMLELMHDYGMVIVRNGPVERDTIEKVAARVGCIHESTVLKRIDDVVINKDVKFVTNTPMRLFPHTDLCYRYTPPGVSFLSCLDSAEEGGESTMVDGFTLAETLRQRNPEAFRLLSTVPQQFHRHHAGRVAHNSDGRVIAVDTDGNVVGFRYAHRVTAAPLSVPEELVEPLYLATRELVKLMIAPEFCAQFKLKPGETICFDNHRVLHGRTAYDPASGRRHLLRCEVDREEFHSNLRILLRKFGREREALMTYPVGALA